MAGTTTQVAIDGADWTLVAQNVTGVVLQAVGTDPICIAVAASKPTAGSDVGIVLRRDDISTLPLFNLESGADIVYAKAKADAVDEVVTVLTTGG